MTYTNRLKKLYNTFIMLQKFTFNNRVSGYAVSTGKTGSPTKVSYKGYRGFQYLSAKARYCCQSYSVTSCLPARIW